MKFGMNLLLWTGEMNDSMVPVVEMLRHVGYDGVELPIFNTGLDYASWGKRLDSLGLQRTAVCIRTEEDNPISKDAGVRRKGIENSMRTLDCCAATLASSRVWRTGPGCAPSIERPISSSTMPPATRKAPRLVPARVSTESPASAESTSTQATVTAAAAATRGRDPGSPWVTTRKKGIAANGFRIAASVIAKRTCSDHPSNIPHTVAGTVSSS